MQPPGGLGWGRAWNGNLNVCDGEQSQFQSMSSERNLKGVPLSSLPWRYQSDVVCLPCQEQSELLRHSLD